MAEPAQETPCFSMEKAERAFLDGNFEEALKHFFVCIRMLPVERRGVYEDQFAAALHGWIALDHNNASRAVCLYPQIKELFPETIRTKIALIRAVQGTEQSKWLLNCLPICKDSMDLATKPEDLVALRIARVNLTTIPFPQWHIRMINDVKRNEAFAKALNDTIKSRITVVFDIGSGTGILSAIAARKTNLVTALEENMCLTMISKEVLKRNGVESRVNVHAKNSTYFETCEKADIVVSETLDCCVFGEKIVETFLDAHVRFSHDRTIFIPHQATVYVRLFSCREIFDIHCQDYGGVRYRSEYVKIGESDAEQPYWCASAADYSQFELLSGSVAMHSVDFSSIANLKDSLANSNSFKIRPAKDGVAHGFSVHFTSDLTGHGDNIIDSSKSRAWDLGIIPFKEPCLVKCDKEYEGSWKLLNNRLDVYNDFYDENLQKHEDSLRYETASLDQLQKIRDDSYFKAMMGEIDPIELPFTRDISSSIPAQCVLNTVESQTPIRHLITNFCRYDGTLDQETFFRIEEFVGFRDHVQKIVPTKFRILGHLFYSDRVHFDARPDPSAHCQVDLSTVRSFNLREMRDIRLTQREDIVMASKEFVLYDFNISAEKFRQDTYITVTQDVTVQPTRPIADGVIYEFEILGIRNTKLRPVAAFLFPERVNTNPDMTVVFDLHLGEMLISLKDLP